MSTTPVWVPIVSALAGTVLGYFLGGYRDRNLERYRKQVESAAELRARAIQWAGPFSAHLLQVGRLLDKDGTPKERSDGGRLLYEMQRLFAKIQEDVSETYVYFHGIKLWLPGSLQIAYEDLASPVLSHAGSLEEILRELGRQAMPGGARLTERQKRHPWERLEKVSAEAERWARDEGPEGLSSLRANFEEEVQKVIGVPLWKRVLFGG